MKADWDIQVEVLWVVMACTIMLGYQHFEGDSMDL